MNRRQADIFALFSQAATAMSAGILLMVIGSPAPIFFLGFSFSAVSIVFLVAALIQASPKWHRFPDAVRRLGGGLTFSFILINLTAIIVGWATILEAVTGADGTTQGIIPEFQSASSYAIPIWIVAFALILCFVAIVGVSRNIKSDKKEFGVSRTVYRYMATVGLVAGLFGICSPLLASNVGTRIQWVLFTLSVPLVVGMVIYLHRELGSTRKSFVERREKARESATTASTMARFVGDSLTFNYPPMLLKAILEIPLQRLEDELEALKAYRDALK